MTPRGGQGGERTDEERARHERERPQRMAFGDATVEWIKVGGNPREMVEKVWDHYRRHGPNGGRA